MAGGAKSDAPLGLIHLKCDSNEKNETEGCLREREKISQEESCYRKCS